MTLLNTIEVIVRQQRGMHSLIGQNISELNERQYDFLTDFEKYTKGLIKLQDGATNNNPVSLEEATIIFDDIKHRHQNNAQLSYITALTHYFSGRFSEAQDALFETKKAYPLTSEDQELERIINAEVERNINHKKLSLAHKPKKSYVMNYSPKNEKELSQLLNSTESSEVILVVDNIEHLDYLKSKLYQSLISIEDEKDIYERFDNKMNVKTRIILKNNNNGHNNKGINLGIKHAKQKNAKDIYYLDSGKFIPATEKIQSNENLSKLYSNNKKHVSFICTTSENTHGVPVVMNNIANQLKLNPNYKVSYILNNFDNTKIEYKIDDETFRFNNREEFLQFINERGIKIDILHTHTWHISDKYKPFNSQRDSVNLKEFLDRLNNPSLVYTNHANPTEDLRRINDKIDYLSLSEEEKQRYLESNALEKVHHWEEGWVPTTILAKQQLMDLADVVTFVSETQKNEEREMIPHYQFGDKEQVIFNGVDIGKYVDGNLQQEATQLKIDLNLQDKKVILYAGRMDAEKGIYDLAKAVEIARKQNDDLILVYLGDAPVGIQHHIYNLAPTTPIHFPGRINGRREMAKYYAMADMVIQPTWGECFNQVMAEALAVGTPGIVSDFSATGEIYVHNGIALGSEVRNPEHLAQQILRLNNDRDLYRSIQEKGKDFVDTKLNVRSMYEKYHAIYETLS